MSMSGRSDHWSEPVYNGEYASLYILTSLVNSALSSVDSVDSDINDDIIDAQVLIERVMSKCEDRSE